MFKQSIAILLLVPVIGWAECGFVSESQEMTIVVSKQSNNKCFKSEQFREAFRANLVTSVKSMEQSSPVTAQAAVRRARPPGLPMPVQQAELYYGQTKKR